MWREQLVPLASFLWPWGCQDSKQVFWDTDSPGINSSLNLQHLAEIKTQDPASCTTVAPQENSVTLIVPVLAVLRTGTGSPSR